MNHLEQNCKVEPVIVTAQKDLFRKVLFCAIFRTASRISTKFSHKVEGWTGSNPIENVHHRLSCLAAFLEKLCFHKIMTIHVLLTVLV